MSRSTTSGRNVLATSRAAGPSWATRTSWPVQPQQHGQAVGGVRVVVDDQDAAARGGAAASAPPAPVGGLARRARPGRGGRRTTNSLPRPGPSLRASTVPPCISTRLFTSVRPMPSPPCERSPARGRPGRTGRRRGAACPAAMPMPVSRTRSTASPPSRRGRQPDPARPARCTWRRCSAGCRPPAPAASGRRPAAAARRGSATVRSWPLRLDQRPGRLDRPRRRPRPGRPAPCAARSCPG